MQPDKKQTNLLLPFLLFILGAVLLSLLTWLLDSRLDAFPHLPDRGASWYYWKLPQPEFLSRVTAWGGYLLHQIFCWIVVVLALKEKHHSRGLSPINYLALGGNLFFVLLHLVQTHLFYDGLAQDVPVWSSQYSVIGMLVIILLLLIRRRGIFWGKKLKLPRGVRHFLGRYHGFYISWALVYTFWFHPMEGDPAILSGFFYMFLLFIHVGVVNTTMHSNIYWITLLEVFVTLHGVAIALMNAQAIWPMFLFGFLFMFVFTQMHGLGLPRFLKIFLLLLFGAGFGVAYFFRGWGRIYEITFIPVTLYGMGAALTLLIALGLKIKTFFLKQDTSRTSPGRETQDNRSERLK